MADPEKSDPFEAKAAREIAEATAKAKATLANLLGKREDQQKQRHADEGEKAAEAKKAEEQKRRSEASKPVIVPFVKPRSVEPPIYDEKDLTRVPGIVGRMTNWIEAASLYPNRPLALGTSLVTVGTLMGQRVAGPTQGSTHL